MSQYRPDSWVPVLLESQEHGKIYKILCSWYGGLAGSDYWKLSSGVESITTNPDGTLTIPQSSGSVYHVPARTHVSNLIGAMYANFTRQAGESEGKFTIKMLELEEFVAEFK